MIGKTRVKIVLVTMAILLAVFVSIGFVTFYLMESRPPRYIFKGMGEPPASMPEIQQAVEDMESQLTREWLMWYSIFAATGFVGLSALTAVLSKWIVAPLKATMQKQRQFVSDASHELKTPLSIILASADVLNADSGDKWLQNIKEQAERMRVLTNDLLALARIDEDSLPKTQPISISEAVIAAVLPFESVVFEAGRTLSVAIAPDINGCGEREDIIKAVGILLDNAIKYSDERGTISVKLVRQGGRALLEVYNTGRGVKPNERGKIFDRFYRSDYSRSRAQSPKPATQAHPADEQAAPNHDPTTPTSVAEPSTGTISDCAALTTTATVTSGGNGLGLSILKSLADKRGWKLHVSSDGKTYAAFYILF